MFEQHRNVFQKYVFYSDPQCFRHNSTFKFVTELLRPTTWMTDNLHRSLGVSPLTKWTSFQLRAWRGLQSHDRIWRLQILVEPEVTLLTLIMQQFVFGECFIE